MNVPLSRLFFLLSVSLSRFVPPCLDQCAEGGLRVCRYVWVEGMGWGSSHMTTGALLYAFTIDDPLCVRCMSTMGIDLVCPPAFSVFGGGAFVLQEGAKAGLMNKNSHAHLMHIYIEIVHFIFRAQNASV